MARKCIEDPWNRHKGGGRKERSGYFPFLWQNFLFRKRRKSNNRQTLIFVIAVNVIAERRIPGVLPDLWYQIEQNLSEEFGFASGDAIKAITPLTFAIISIRLSYATASPRKRCDKSSKWIGRSAAAHNFQCQHHTRDASSQKHQVLSSQIHLAARKGNNSTSSVLSNNMMKKVLWILRMKTAEMYFLPCFVTNYSLGRTPSFCTSKTVCWQDLPATSVNVRLIFTLPLHENIVKDQTETEKNPIVPHLKAL